MITTVEELIAELEQYGPTAPVFIAYQPNYPMAAGVSHIATELGPMRHNGTDDERVAVYIAATETVGYAGAEVYDREDDQS